MNRSRHVSITIIILLTCASPSLSYASPVISTRRHLQQAPLTDGSPFFPPETSSSSSSSSSPPPPLPQQPLPPPAPTYVTFPANISALVLPRSPKPQAPSKTLLIPIISAVLAVATALGFALFLYGKWKGRNRHFTKENSNSENAEGRTVISKTNQKQTESCSVPRNITENKLSVVASTSSSGFVKPDSPEIRPLPPLPSRSFEANHLSSEEEEEDDDFYSPLASLAGRESIHQRNNNNPYSNCSSNTNSPTMSPSITSTAAPSPETRVRINNNNNNKRYGPSLRMFSTLGFPRISSASTSPERGTDAYARSSMYSSVSTTPDRFFLRKVLESSPPRWNDFSRNVKSLFLGSSSNASPARDFVINMSESSRSLKSSFGESSSSHVPPPPPQRPPPVLPEPPALVPPSQSFIVQKCGKKLSFSELPHWEGGVERVKTKLKPLPWENVRPRKNTWDSLKFNSLDAKLKQRSQSCDLPMMNQESSVLGSRKCESIALLLTNLKLTANDVCQALLDGNYEGLGVELLESLSRIAPNEEEEKKLNDSVAELSPSERFLKDLLNVPFVFKRVDALLSVASFDSNAEHLKRSFSVIQAACEELRNSRMLLKLIEVVLETGMKSGNARDFKLEALLKLIGIKSLDGRTTLLHKVVRIIVESEGIKVLQVIGNLSSVLVSVKKTAEMNYGLLRNDMSRLYQGVQRVSEVLLLNDENGSNEEFRESMTRFLETAVEEIKKIETKEGLVLSAMKDTTENFHGDLAKEEAQLLRVFVIMRDFLSILDGVCKEMEVGR